MYGKNRHILELLLINFNAKRVFICILFTVLTVTVPAQIIQVKKVAIKTGFTVSDQIKTPSIFGDSGIKFGLLGGIEPTFNSFGTKKQFDFNIDLYFIQKGGGNQSPVITRDPNGNITGIGSETYPVTINYLSFTPCIKFIPRKIFYLKAGPRADAFLSFKKKDRFESDPRSLGDFNSVTFGVSYALGLCFGKKQTKFIVELSGQNDFTESSYNPASGQSFKNYCYFINFGILRIFEKQI